MSPRLPRVRHFVACEQVEVSPDGKQCTLVNLVSQIRPAPGEAYPLLQEQLYLFAQLTDGYGQHSFQLQVVRLDDGLEEVEVYATSPFTRDLGKDPLAVYGLPLRIENLPFERPGEYAALLFCDGQEIAREPILLGEES